MAATTFYVKSGDTAPAITQALTDANGNVISLASATVRFHMEDASGNVITDAAATILNASTGQVSYQWAAADLVSPGTFYARWIITFTGGTIESVPDAALTPLEIIIEGSIAPYRILVGPSKEDIVPFVRGQIEDYTAGSFTIPDSTFQATVSKVARDFSRFRPLSNPVGDFFAQTSPLVTVANQHRYQCNSGAGFTNEIAWITDVLYRASGGFSAASEIGYMALLPFSPANTFLFTPSLVDAPSRRILRDEYLNEIDHYGVGQAGVLIDSTGAWVLDLFPVPVTSGLPIFVLYNSPHQVTTDAQGNANVLTVRPFDVQHFQSLVLAEILRILAIRVTRQIDAKAGQIEVKASAADLRELYRDTLDHAHLALGGAAGVGDVSS